MSGYDVDGALARGAPAVDVLSDYVAACRALGRTATDPGQLHDAYAAEDGMDLGALDADCATVEAALGNVREATRLQDEARTLLVGAWQGPGADVAAQTVAQHAQSSESAAVALHRVADTLAELRDTLWQLVSGKVDAVQGIEDRAEREQWWPAARAVNSGAGAQDTASEIVDGKVNPFVTVAIGSDWADVMDSTKRSVRDAYDAAAAGISADPPATFGGGAPAPEPVVSAPVAAPPPADPFAGGAALGGLGSGMPSLGTGLTGTGTQLADLIGGLLNSGADTSAGDPLEPADDPGDVEMDEDSSDEDLPDDSEEDDADEDDDLDDSDEDDPDEGDDPAAEAGDVAEVVAPESDPPVPTPVPEPVPVAAPDEPVTPAPPAEPSRTPCEIASDELPQAGG